MQKVEFTVKVDGEDKTFLVRMPDSKMRRKAKELKNEFFAKKAFEPDTVFANQVHELVKKKGLWSDAKDEEIKQVSKDIEEKIRLVSKGKSEKVPNRDALRKIIVDEVKPLRSKQLQLLAERSQLDDISLENAAQQLEIDYLISECTYEESGGDLGAKVFSSLEDYKLKADEPYSEEAGRKLSELIGLSNPNWLVDLPENKILIKEKLMNDKGFYLNKDGDLISVDGKRINDKGFYIDADGNQVDSNGDKVNDEGDIIEYNSFDEE